jgi:hypothetical protein
VLFELVLKGVALSFETLLMSTRANLPRLHTCFQTRSAVLFALQTSEDIKNVIVDEGGCVPGERAPLNSPSALWRVVTERTTGLRNASVSWFLQALSVYILKAAGLWHVTQTACVGVLLCYCVTVTAYCVCVLCTVLLCHCVTVNLFTFHRACLHHWHVSIPGLFRCACLCLCINEAGYRNVC